MTPRPKAPRAGGHGSAETRGAQKSEKKKRGGGQDAKAQGSRGRKTRNGGDKGAQKREKKTPREWGGGAAQDAKAPGTQGRETRHAGDKGGAEGAQIRKNHKQGDPSLEGAEQTKRAPRTATGKCEAHQNAPEGRPARPDQEEHAHAHTRGTRV